MLRGDMDRLRDSLAAKARAVIPGLGYNAFRGEQEKVGPGQAVPLFFEAALPALQPEKALVDQIVPSFLRFLQRKNLNLDSPQNVLVAVFLGDSCFVLPGDALIDIFCELEGITQQALGFRRLAWLED